MKIAQVVWALLLAKAQTEGHEKKTNILVSIIF